MFIFIVVVFDWASCLYFSANFIHRPLIFFVRLCVIEWGIDHDYAIVASWVIRWCVNGLILKKMIFNRFWKIFNLLNNRIRRNLFTRHVPIDFKFGRMLWKMKCEIFIKFCVSGAFSLIFSKRIVEKYRFFSMKYAFCTLAYCLATWHDRIMIDTSFVRRKWGVDELNWERNKNRRLNQRRKL